MSMRNLDEGAVPFLTCVAAIGSIFRFWGLSSHGFLAYKRGVQRLWRLVYRDSARWDMAQGWNGRLNNRINIPISIVV